MPSRDTAKCTPTPPQAPRSAEETNDYLTSIQKSYYYDPSVFSTGTPPMPGGPNSHHNFTLGGSAAAPTAGGAKLSLGASAVPATNASKTAAAVANFIPRNNSIADAMNAGSFGNPIANNSNNTPGSPTDWANANFTTQVNHFNTGMASRHTDTPPLQSHALARCALVTGNSNPQLAVDVAALLGKDLHPVSVLERNNGEISVKIRESVNDKDVFIVHSMCARDESHDINEGIMELLFMIRKLKQSYAASITAVVPAMAYGRQDQKTDLRVPISSSAIAMMMMQMGVDRVVSLDLHSGQIQGAFNAVPVDSLSFLHEFAQHIRQQAWFDAPHTMIVSPDASGVERAKRLGDIICAPAVITIVRRRLEGGKVDCMQAVGEVKGKSCIIVDDIIDSGKTLLAAADILKEMGAARIIACITHGMMSGKCSEKIANSPSISQLVVSDSIPQNDHKAVCGQKLVVLPTAPLLAMSILQILRNSSAGNLFTEPTDKNQLLKLVHAQML